MSRRWKPILGLVLLTLSLEASAALSADEVRALREELADSFDTARLGAGYAALLSFAVSPQISTATYRPDTHSAGAHDPRLDVYRVPLRFAFGDDDSRTRPFLQGVLAYQDYAAGLDAGPGEFIDADWEAYGLSVSGGLDVPLNEHLRLFPAISLGYGRLENSADYSGPVSETLLQPLLSGFIFDWDAEAVIYGAALGLDYQRRIGEFETELLASLTRNRIESFNESHDAIGFSSGVTALDMELSTVRATGVSLGRYPLSWVLFAGHTRFYGSNRDALGFSYFHEAGLALQLNPRPGRHRTDRWRLGLSSIFGEDVEGWSLVLTHEF